MLCVYDVHRKLGVCMVCDIYGMMCMTVYGTWKGGCECGLCASYVISVWYMWVSPVLYIYGAMHVCSVCVWYVVCTGSVV